MTNIGKINLGAPLPELSISQKGLLTNAGDDVIFKPWNSSDDMKLRVIHHMSASIMATLINKKFVDQLDATNLPKDIITTVANLSDAKLGFGGVVLKEMIKNKKVKQGIIIVADEQGLARKQWDLPANSSAIIIVDEENRIRFIKEGKLQADEIEAVIAILTEKEKIDA